jgi:ketosteroid isomerase-like protein
MMKRSGFGKLVRLGAFLAVFSLMPVPAAVQADYRSNIADQVRAAVGEFVELYGKHDIEGIMSLFADDPGIVAIGLREGQVAVGPEAVRNLFEKDLSTTEGTVKLPFEVVSIDNLGLAAWLSANVYPYVVLKNGSTVKGYPGRMTLVLRKIKGKWHILQVHFSVPSDSGSVTGKGQLAGKKAP